MIILTVIFILVYMFYYKQIKQSIIQHNDALHTNDITNQYPYMYKFFIISKSYLLTLFFINGVIIYDKHIIPFIKNDNVMFLSTLLGVISFVLYYVFLIYSSFLLNNVIKNLFENE